MTRIWQFKTKNFRVEMTAESPTECLDLSWDESGEATDKINSGEWEAFTAKCAVYFRGEEIGTDYLGECIYADVKDFRDHIGMNARGHGSYFSDMVRSAIEEARNHFGDMPYIRAA